MGPVLAGRVQQMLLADRENPAKVIARAVPPAAAAADWPALVELVQTLTDPNTPWPGQLARVRRFYEPHLERLYDNARTRLADLDQIERLADAAPSRERFLSDLTLDPPESAGPWPARPTSTRTS